MWKHNNNLQTRFNLWLKIQGFDARRLPRSARWYKKDGTYFEGKLDQYHIELYRLRGCVLDKRYTSMATWYLLEYGGHEWLDEQKRLRPDMELDWLVGEPQYSTEATTRLASALIDLMDGRDEWVGTATELLAELPEKEGIPKTPIKLSASVIQQDITSALDYRGIGVKRERNADKRTLRLARHNS